MNKLYCLLLIFIACGVNTIQAQEFINGDLSGTIINVSSLPTSWFNVPYGDVNCNATNTVCATPDLTSSTLPGGTWGVIGNPYSGSTFVSGLFSSYSGLSAVYQEGIMQTVSGFIPGNTYPINFHQAVVKQIDCLDSSGSWAVFIDTVLAGITAPTYSAVPFNSTSFNWEFRTIMFVATAVSHTIKFLPVDNDSSTDFIDSAGVRMGIDCIYIYTPCDSVNTGIKDNNFKNSIIISPNPFSNKLNISAKTNEQLEVSLYDVTSRKIFNQSFTKSTTINTEQLAKGIYLYEVRNKNGVIKQGKVVKD